jgi:hypothetical protein
MWKWTNVACLLEFFFLHHLQKLNANGEVACQSAHLSINARFTLLRNLEQFSLSLSFH